MATRGTKLKRNDCALVEYLGCIEISVRVVNGMDASGLARERHGRNKINLRILELSLVLLPNLGQWSGVTVHGDVLGRVPVTGLVCVWVEANLQVTCCGILPLAPTEGIVARPGVVTGANPAGQRSDANGNVSALRAKCD